MSGGFELLSHTADVLVRAWGDTLEEAFSYAAMGMFEVMTDISKVEPVQEKELSVKGFDLKNLLYNWLEELIILFDVEQLLVSQAKVIEIVKGEDLLLRAIVKGEKYDPNKHESKVLVKAATYHMMEIKKEKNRYVLQFVVDI